MSDLHRWHEEARRPSPPEPAAVTPLAWSTMTSDRRSAHIGELRAWFSSLLISTRAAQRTTSEISRVVTENKYTPPGAKRIAVVSGPNAVGKSTMINDWARQHYRHCLGRGAMLQPGPAVWNPLPGVEADLAPIVRINMQANARIKEFDSQALQFLGLPGEGVARQMTNRLTRAMRRHGVEVLIVDDVHLLRTRLQGGRDVLDHLKHINTELGEHHATLVLVGADLIDGHIVTDPQIAGRLELFELHSVSIDTPEQQAAWQSLLQGVERPLLRHLPSAQPGFLCAQAAGLIWRPTQGYLGDVTALVSGALGIALTTSTFTISGEHLQAVALTRRAELAKRALERPTRVRTP